MTTPSTTPLEASFRQPSVVEAAEATALVVAAVRDTLRDYHYALDTRQHGGVAAHAVVESLQILFGMPWVQGAEKARRDTETQPPQAQLR